MTPNAIKLIIVKKVPFFFSMESFELVVMGTSLQSIYGWVGSDCRVLQKFLDDNPRARGDPQQTCYRCRPSIIKVAESVLQVCKYLVLHLWRKTLDPSKMLSLAIYT